MQLYVPALDLIFVPILKNASRVLTQAIHDRYPDVSTVGPHIEGERVVMWRNPKDRIESAFKMRADQGIEEDFSRWVVDICTSGLETHLKPQIEYCDNPMYLFRWDFDGFKKLFRLKREIPHENESGTHYYMDWTSEARFAFELAYKHDIRIWERKYGT